MKYGKPIITTITTGEIKLEPDGVPQVRFSFGPYKAKEEIKKIIINYGATIIFWSDGDKTISRRHEEDKFDKELGFLFAYYYKKCGFTKAGRKRVLDCINYDKIKTFLFEFYVKESKQTHEQARKYLANLKVDY